MFGNQAARAREFIDLVDGGCGACAGAALPALLQKAGATLRNYVPGYVPLQNQLKGVFLLGDPSGDMLWNNGRVGAILDAAEALSHEHDDGEKADPIGDFVFNRHPMAHFFGRLEYDGDRGHSAFYDYYLSVRILALKNPALAERELNLFAFLMRSYADIEKPGRRPMRRRRTELELEPF